MVGYHPSTAAVIAEHGFDIRSTRALIADIIMIDQIIHGKNMDGTQRAS